MTFREAVTRAWRRAKRKPINAQNQVGVYWDGKNDNFVVEEFIGRRYPGSMYEILRLTAADGRMRPQDAIDQADAGLAKAKHCKTLAEGALAITRHSDPCPRCQTLMAEAWELLHEHYEPGSYETVIAYGVSLTCPACGHEIYQRRDVIETDWDARRDEADLIAEMDQLTGLSEAWEESVATPLEIEFPDSDIINHNRREPMSSVTIKGRPVRTGEHYDTRELGMEADKTIRLVAIYHPGDVVWVEVEGDRHGDKSASITEFEKEAERCHGSNLPEAYCPVYDLYASDTPGYGFWTTVDLLPAWLKAAIECRWEMKARTVEDLGEKNGSENTIYLASADDGQICWFE